jgi:SAM-dependent methyltransferase
VLRLSQRLARLYRRFRGTRSPLVGPIPRPPWSPPGNLREHLAREFIRGSGLEIGALYNPLFVPPGVRVTYVDRYTVAELRAQLAGHADLCRTPLVPVDLLDDGETLARVADASQDFVIANHFLEHTQDPIGTVRRHLQVLRPGGVLFLGVPDKRFTFDAPRPVTSPEHLYRDHEEGPDWSYLTHLREWVEHVEQHRGAELEARVAQLAAERPPIHFHVWTQEVLTELLLDVRRRLALPFDVEAVVLNRVFLESICVLRKV